ncbi:MAG TPA: hypothetical protein G4N98_07430 [Thermoflexia bacterium]|nr:hypothetical protein [Thermoflexia bacterium]
MGTQRKASIRELISDAYRLEARVTQGRLHRNPQDGRWMIGNTHLNEWFDRQAGEDVSLLLIPTESRERGVETRTCHTCGRQYSGSYCPYCRRVRLRLRGE